LQGSGKGKKKKKGEKSRYLIFIACLQDQNKSGFFERPAFIQPIRAISKVFKNL